MSENRNRRTDEFSKYDSMTTEELEEILRLDSEAPEELESDTELLLYVMGVLANRRNNTDNTGKTALEAWESFQQHYLPAEEEGPDNMKEPVKRFGPWMRRLTAAAAVVVLAVCLPLSANAFGWEDIWNIFARWAKETFSFVSSETAEVSEPSPEYEGEYSSLQDMLIKNKASADLAPTWIPDGFTLEVLKTDMAPISESYSALYTAGEKELTIRIHSYLSPDSFAVEIGEDVVEIYESSGITYYIFENMDQIRFVWSVDSYECNVSGDMSIEEAKKMIDSIGKG